MRSCRIISQVDVVGRLWMGGQAAYTYPLSKHDIENIRERGNGNITRDAVSDWLDSHSGDFQSIKDFRVTIGDGEFDSDFATPEGEDAYLSCFPVD